MFGAETGKRGEHAGQKRGGTEPEKRSDTAKRRITADRGSKTASEALERRGQEQPPRSRDGALHANSGMTTKTKARQGERASRTERAAGKREYYEKASLEPRAAGARGAAVPSVPRSA